MDAHERFGAWADGISNLLIFFAAMVFLLGSILLGVVLSDLDQGAQFSAYAYMSMVIGMPALGVVAILASAGLIVRAMGTVHLLRAEQHEDVLEALSGRADVGVEQG